MKYSKNREDSVKKRKVVYTFIAVFGIILGSLLIVETFRTSRSNTETVANQNMTMEDNARPYPSSDVTNMKLFLIGVNQSNTVRGGSFTLKGYVQRHVSGSEYANKSGVPIYPVIDGKNYDGTSGNPNWTVYSQEAPNLGLFEITITVPEDYDYTKNMTVTANVTHTPPEYRVNELTVKNSSISIDVTTTTLLSVEMNYGTNRAPPLIPGDTFSVKIYFNDSLGNPLTMNGLIFGFNNYSDNNRTVNIVSGYHIISNLVLESNMTSIHVSFNGFNNSGQSYYEYLPQYNHVTIPLFSGIKLTANFINEDNASTTDIYHDGIVKTDILVTDLGPAGFPIINRTYELYLNDVSVANGSTDAEGKIIQSIKLSTYSFQPGETLTFTVVIKTFDGEMFSAENFNESSTLQVQARPPPIGEVDTVIPPPPESNWWMLIPIGIVFGLLVVGVIIFQRKRMELTKMAEFQGKVFDTSVFGSLSSLYLTGRISEAIAYLFIIYRNTINGKFNLKYKDTETMRDFAIMVINKYGQDPIRIHPFVAFVESYIYGGKKAEKTDFLKGFEMFQRLYWNLTGEVLDYQIPVASEGSTSSSISISQPTSNNT